MTVSTSTTREFSIGLIVRRAMHLAGILEAQQEVSEADAALARDLLEVIVDSLSTEGEFARSVKFYDLSLTAGTYRYTLPADILDLVGDAMYLPPGEVDATKVAGESLVRRVLREEWQVLSSKQAEGIPMLVYMHRELAQVQAWFWPIPSEAPINSIPAKVRLPVHRLLADNNDANATPDLTRDWVSFLQWQLGHDLSAAKTLPVDRLMYYQSRADYYRERCKQKAHQRGPIQAYVVHPTPWSR